MTAFAAVIPRLAGAERTGLGEIAAALSKIYATPCESAVFDGCALLAAPIIPGSDSPLLIDTISGIAATGQVLLEDRHRLTGALGLPQHTHSLQLSAAAFERWGTTCTERFGGEFALAMWNVRERAFLGMTARTAQAIYRGLGAWPLTHADRYPVDLHFRLCHVSFGSPLTPEAVIGESRELDGAPGVRLPSATHAALMLLVHASKHLWCTLEMLLAIARAMEHNDVDWVRVQTLARRSGTWNGCAAGLGLASELFGVKIPDGISHGGNLRARAELRREARAALLKPAGVFADRWEERRSHRAALDRFSGRVRCDVCRLVSPTPLERNWFELPESLTSLYLPLRLIRLTVSAARGALRQAGTG